MGKLTIQDIAVTLQENNGISKKEANTFVNEMFDIIQQSLEQDKIVKIKGLGTFKIIDVNPRESVNVNTGERVLIEGHNKITFTPDPLMKDLVNKPFSQFETVVLNEGVDFNEGETVPEPPTDETLSMPLVDFSDPSQEENIEEEQEASSDNDRPIFTLGEIEEENTVDNSTEDAPKETSEEEVQVGGLNQMEGDDSDIEDNYNNQEETPTNRKFLIIILALLIGAVIGYIIGNLFPFSNKTVSDNAITKEVADTHKPKQEPTATRKDSSTATIQTKDSVTSASKIPNKSTEVTHKAEKEEKKSSVEKHDAQPAPSATTKDSDNKPQAKDVDKYGAMDARVRTGAYRIIGTERIVKAKQGETLSKISRSILGPDMECYMEVYNGIKASTPLKAGQQIKIPKLELKKKRKVSTSNK